MNLPEQSDRRPRVLWLGPIDGDEFAPALAELRESCEVVVATGNDAGSAGGLDLAICACPRPLMATGVVESLRETLGPSSVVQLLGVWCEGEGRTGKVVDGVERVFWHQWSAWLRRWRERSESENESLGGVVEVRTTDAEFAASLIEAIAPVGAAVWAQAAITTPPVAVLWDGSQLGGREADDLFRVCRQAARQSAPVVAMLDFPRPETARAARDLGATAVIGKPFDREALIDTIRSSLRQAPNRPKPMATSPNPPSVSLREALQAERESLACEAA